ncbi:MAG: hypothetical protein J3K34DRAFT_523876 [Monoraphidium minutum]|nr:MAG: hypothetical protein J3K34DRAFT_523876 [Monoraphidium minutum]
MGLGQLLGCYAFLSTYVPGVLVPVQRAGWPRLVAALPAIAVCLYTPALVPWGIPRVVVGCITMWLSSFKLLAFVGNRGPLARPDLTMLQRTLLFLMPIHPRSPRWGMPPTVAWIMLVLLGKVALQAVVALLLTYAELHPFVVHSLWAVCIWNLVAMGVDIMAPFVQYIMGMPLNPSMHQPYLSATIQEFWSQRYNLVTTTCLRQTVYEPIIDGAFVRAPSEAQLRAGSTGPDAEVAIASRKALALAADAPPRRRGDAVPQLDAGDGASASGSSASTSSSSCASDGEGDTGGTGLRRRRGGDDADADVKGGKRDQGACRPLDMTATAGAAAAPPPPAAPAKPVAEWRKSLATLMVFVASGIMHEALIWYMCHANGYRETGRYVFGPVLVFFVLQAPALQAEKIVLKAAASARRALLGARPPRPSPPPPSTPAARAAAAARRAGGAALDAAWLAARVVMVFGWLWGLADFTFWKSTQSCRIEHYAIPELMLAVDAIKAAGVRLAGALPLSVP